MEHIEAARRWADALSEPSEPRKAALAEVLADGVVAVSPLGTTEGKTEVLAGFGRSPLAEPLARASWSDGVGADSHLELTATFAPSAPVGGLVLRFSFNDAGQISRVETGVLPAPPPEPVPVHITEGMRAAVNGALGNQTPVMVAYVDRDGQPHLSFRGTTQVFSDDQLALWIRNPQGGLVAAIEHNPRLALFYRDPASRTAYQFHGRAHAEHDAATADKVYSNSPEVERNMDPNRNGAPVVVDLDRIEGRDASGQVVMVRPAGT
jgi:general stress protein 26